MASSGPGDNGREGKKGLRNLAEALNGVERRGEGLGSGRRAAEGGARLRAAGVRRSEPAAQALQQSPERGRRRRRRRGGRTARPTPPVASRPPPHSKERALRALGEVGRGRLRGASPTEPGRGAATPPVSAAAAGVLGAAAPPSPETAGSAAHGVGVGCRAAGREGAEGRASGASACGGWARRGAAFPGSPAPPAASASPGNSRGPGSRAGKLCSWPRARRPVRAHAGPRGGRRASRELGAWAWVAALRYSFGRSSPRTPRSCCPRRPGRRRAQLTASRGRSLLGARGIPGPEKRVGKETALWSHRSPWPGSSSVLVVALPGPGSSDPRPQPSLYPPRQKRGSRSVSPGRLLLFSPAASVFF